MMLFVAVYLAQWWAGSTYGFWNLFEEPHIVINVATVVFSNLGGTFNLIVYLQLQRKKVEPIGPKTTNVKTTVTRVE